MSKDKSSAFELDNILYLINHKGRYQICQAIICLLSCVSCAYPILSIVFIGYAPKHQCAPLSNLTNLYDYDIDMNDVTEVKTGQCSLSVITNISGKVTEKELPCLNGYHYDVDRETSIVSDWDLVCDRAGLSEMSQTMLMLGQGFGACIFTSFADRYGRKPANVICQLGLIISSIAVAFVNDIISFTVLRFIIGACQQGVGLTAYSILVEMCTVDMRPLAGFGGGLAWTLSCISLAPLAYFMQYYSWRYFQLVTVGGMIYGLIVYWALHESLRWLVANHKYERAEKAIQHMCKVNNTNFIKAKEELHAQISMDQQYGKTNIFIGKDPNETQEKNGQLETLIEKTGISEKNSTDNTPSVPVKYTILDIFKNPGVLKITAILSFIWATNSLTYYGLFLTSSSMSGDRFINYFLNALVEIPAMFIVYFALKKLGRRTVSVYLHTLSGMALIISVTLLATTEKSSIGAMCSTIFSLLGKLFITASFNCLFILTPELFATNMRNAGMGVASAIARIGGMLSPYSSTLGQLVIWGPGVVFGILCIVASLLFLLLPETRGRELPTTIEEMTSWKPIKPKKETNQ